MIDHMTKQKQLALAIRSKAALRDMTQGELADAINMSRSALSARMRGSREFSFTELDAIAQVLSVPLPELVDLVSSGGESR